MKKNICLFLVTCMLLASTAIFSSCSSSLSAEIAKDSAGAINKSLNTTVENFFDLDLGEDKLFETYAKNGGTMTLSADMSKLINQFGILPNAVLNYKSAIDRNNKKSSSLIDVDLGDMAKFGLNFFTDNKTITLDIPDTDITLSALIDETLKDKFTASKMYEMLTATMSEEEVADLTEQVDMIAASTSLNNELGTIDFGKYINLLNPDIANITLTVDANDIKCIEAKYTIDNTAVKAIVYAFLDDYANKFLENTDYASIDELKSDVDKQLADYTFNGTLSFKMNASDKTMISSSINLSMKNKENEEIVITCELSFSDDKIILDFAVMQDEKSTVLTLTINKTVTDKKTSFDFTVAIKGAEDAESSNVLNLNFTYDSGDKKFDISAEMLSEGLTVGKIQLSGTIEFTSDKGTITITECGMKTGVATVSFDVSFSFVIDTAIDMTEAPADAKNIFELTSEDMEAIFTDIDKFIKPFIGGFDIGGGSDFDDDGEMIFPDGEFYPFEGLDDLDGYINIPDLTDYK